MRINYESVKVYCSDRVGADLKNAEKQDNFSGGIRDLKLAIRAKKEQGFVPGAKVRITSGPHTGDYILEGIDPVSGALNLLDEARVRRNSKYNVRSPVVELIK